MVVAAYLSWYKSYKLSTQYVYLRLYSKSSLTLTLKEWRFNLSFFWVSVVFLNSWRVSPVPYYVTNHPLAIQKQHWCTREAQIQPPLFEYEYEWAFRIQAYVFKIRFIKYSILSLQNTRFIKYRFLKSLFRLRGRKRSTIAIYKQSTPTFLSAISPIMFHAKTSQTHDIPTKLRCWTLIGLGKVMWYQQKVSTQIARVPRTYVVLGWKQRSTRP
jgi:hypothetical protein